MSSQILRKLTPANQSEIISAISAAWKSVFDVRPKLSQVAKVWAQIAAETNKGGAIYNNNVGNIIWTKGNQHDYFMNTDTRSVNGNPANREVYTTAFRSYPTLVDGIIDYLNLLKTMNKGQVLTNLLHGSTSDFSEALADARYYDPYTKDDYIDKAGKKVSGYTSALISNYNNFIMNYRKRHGQPIVPNQTTEGFIDKLEHFVEKLIGANHNQILIIKSNADLSSKLEYARILKSALKTELLLDSDIVMNNDNIGLGIAIPNNLEDYDTAISEIGNAIANVFEYATKKIGSINILVEKNGNSNFIIPDIRLIEKQHRLFRYKFIGQNGK